MKRYIPWLLTISFLTTILWLHADESYAKLIVAMEKFDAALFTKALNDVGPLCIFAQELLMMRLDMQLNNHVRNNTHLIMSTDYKATKTGTFLLGCSGMASAVIGLTVILIRLLHKDNKESAWISYKIGFMSLLYSTCALYKFLSLDAEEKRQHAVVFSKIRETNQQIIDDKKCMLRSIMNHPLKTCCS